MSLAIGDFGVSTMMMGTSKDVTRTTVGRCDVTMTTVGMCYVTRTTVGMYATLYGMYSLV